MKQFAHNLEQNKPEDMKKFADNLEQNKLEDMKKSTDNLDRNKLEDMKKFVDNLEQNKLENNLEQKMLDSPGTQVPDPLMVGNLGQDLKFDSEADTQYQHHLPSSSGFDMEDNSCLLLSKL